MTRGTVIVSGALANKPLNGGEAWVRLSWARGFQRLGWRVCFIEQIARQTCVNEQGNPVSFERSINLQYFRRVTQQFGLSDCAALLCDDGAACGCAEHELDDVARSADLLVNVSGHLTHPRLMPLIKRKVYVDIDPGFTQFWHEQGLARVRGHDFYFTIGENVGAVDCPIPTSGIDWRPIRQPVVLDDWPVASPPRKDRFTTVAAWRGSFGSVAHDGRTYGLKVHEFRKVMELPRRSPHRFEIALQIHAGDGRDRTALEANGWRITDPRSVAAEPESFRQYVLGSSAEFSVAQGIYVDTNSGWFSDRTIRYLAAGRPALVQETGFSRNLGGDGLGLVPFRTLDDAIAGADRIVHDYEIHSRAARALAERVFDSDKVLAKLLEEVGVTS